jgi:hypothetical protein
VEVKQWIRELTSNKIKEGILLNGLKTNIKETKQQNQRL